MQGKVNGRGERIGPDRRQHLSNSCSSFMNRERDYSSAVRLVLALMLILVLPGISGAENGRGYLDLSAGYKTGDFGAPMKSELYYVSPTLGYVAPLYDVSVAVPYLYLSNKTGGATTSESGVGDVILRGGRVFIPEGEGGFSLDGALAVKLPTADKNKGLGTGETDYGAFLGAHQQVAGVKLSLLSGYIKVGEPSGVTYNDVYSYGFGISKVFGFTELYAFIEGRRAMIPGAQDPEEVSVGFFHVLNADYTIKGSAFKGLNNGGPDFGANLGVVRWF